MAEGGHDKTAREWQEWNGRDFTAGERQLIRLRLGLVTPIPTNRESDDLESKL